MGFNIFQAAIEKKPGITMYFVRHGQSDGNTLGKHCPVYQDSHLTLLGKQQAAAIGSYFAALEAPITAVYTSIRERTNSTASAITEATGISAHTSDRLIERNWGKYNGHTWVSLSGELDRMSFDDRYTFVPENGESWQMMEDRLFGVLTLAVESAEPNDSLVIVTHNGCLRALLPLLDGKEQTAHEEYAAEVGSITKYTAATKRLEFHNFIPELVD